jgi:Na+/proline symporter
VLPMLVDHLLPPVLVGLYVAIVLAAIMSTIDSLLVLAGSAAVRDVYQRILHPELDDASLVRASRGATLGLAVAAFAVAMLVALTQPGRTVFWFVIFGWSGIAATFCPTLVLSLFWPGLTRRGAIAAMIGGFLAVPLFKFLGPSLPGLGPVLDALGELPPAFLCSGLLAVGVSLGDPAGRARLASVAAVLDAAAD